MDNTEKIAKLADKINDLITWKDEAQQKEFYNLLGLILPDFETSPSKAHKIIKIFNER